jgi:hypothetical protein
MNWQSAMPRVLQRFAHFLGDDKYNKFVDDLASKRIAQRAPEEIARDSQLEKVIKAESPEKAAKIAGKVTEPSEQAQRIAKTDTPEKAAKISGFDAEKEPAVQSAQARYAKSKAAMDRLKNPSLAEKGLQKVAEHAANELEPSSLVERAAKSPEYTDKLLEVIDKHPQADTLRNHLGQRIFRNASDNAMVQGAFGSTDGTFDVSKFEKEYNSVRPSLERILPADNLTAMDGFNKALDKYALSKGIGGGAGMTGRFLAIRQLFGALSMARGVVTASPGTFAAGAAISFGPRVWMELVTHPNLARGFAATLAKGGAAGAIIGATREAKENEHPARQGSDGKPPQWELRGGQR